MSEVTRKVFSYANQPGNVEAWRLGDACRAAKPGGDLIDQGLSLLKELQERGYGVVMLCGPDICDTPRACSSAFRCIAKSRPLDRSTQTREQAACDKVLAAVRAYLPPGGLTKDEFISRVIEAVDNPEFNAGLKTAEPAEDYDETMMKLHAGWRQRPGWKGEEGEPSA